MSASAGYARPKSREIEETERWNFTTPVAGGACCSAKLSRVSSCISADCCGCEARLYLVCMLLYLFVKEHLGTASDLGN